MMNPARPGLLDDPQLVAGTLAGDRECFGTLVDRYWGTAVAIALTRVSDPSQAEDVAQESFIRAYAHLARLRDPSRFVGWLSRIVVQRSIDHGRLRKRHSPVMTVGLEGREVAAAIAASASPSLSAEQHRQIRDAVRRLPEKWRTVVVLRFVAGLSTEQIGVQLGQHPGTVRVWLHRAYKRLRVDLTPLAEEVRCP